jgi:hypothetical protein
MTAFVSCIDLISFLEKDLLTGVSEDAVCVENPMNNIMPNMMIMAFFMESLLFDDLF